MARRSFRRPALVFGIINRPRPLLSDPSEGAENKDSVGSHTGSWQRTTHTHTHARFISSGNLAPTVETQPSSGCHRNRSNGSLLFVRVASLLPPSPVTTRPPQSLVRHGRQTSALFKDKLMLMIKPSAVQPMSVAQAALGGGVVENMITSSSSFTLLFSFFILFYSTGGL